MASDDGKAKKNDPVALEIRDMLDVPMHVWQQMKTWLETQGLRIPRSQIIGANTLTSPVTLTGLPTADPGVPDQVWNDAGTLKISL